MLVAARQLAPPQVLVAARQLAPPSQHRVVASQLQYYYMVADFWSGLDPADPTGSAGLVVQGYRIAPHFEVHNFRSMCNFKDTIFSYQGIVLNNYYLSV